MRVIKSFLLKETTRAFAGARTHDWQASTYYESDELPTAPSRLYEVLTVLHVWYCILYICLCMFFALSNTSLFHDITSVQSSPLGYYDNIVRPTLCILYVLVLLRYYFNLLKPVLGMCGTFCLKSCIVTYGITYVTMLDQPEECQGILMLE